MKNESVPSNPQTKSQNGIYLQLQTKPAIELFQGSWQFGNMGLIQFAYFIHKVDRAKASYPEAINFLQEIESRLQAKKQMLKSIEQNYQNQLNNLRGFTVDLSLSPSQSFKCSFSNQLCYQVAGLIEQIDYLLRQFRILKRFGSFEAKMQNPHIFIKELQQLFREVRQFKPLIIQKSEIKGV